MNKKRIKEVVDHQFDFFDDIGGVGPTIPAREAARILCAEATAAERERSRELVCRGCGQTDEKERCEFPQDLITRAEYERRKEGR